MYAITRLKAAPDAWYWVVHFTRRGKLYFKRFYDLKCGGSQQARAAAIAWRDEQLAQTEVLTMRDFYAQRRSNNMSGVPGVHFVTLASQPQGAWQAKITQSDGHKVHKSFSIRKFGHEGAFDLAVKARLELLKLDALRLQNPDQSVDWRIWSAGLFGDSRVARPCWPIFRLFPSSA